MYSANLESIARSKCNFACTAKKYPAFATGSTTNFRLLNKNRIKQHTKFVMNHKKVKNVNECKVIYVLKYKKYAYAMKLEMK